jgi:hypothetical protein
MAMKQKKPRVSALELLLRQPRLTAGAAAAVVIGAAYLLAVGPLLDQTAAGGPYDLASRKAETETAEAQAANAKSLISAFDVLNDEYKTKSSTALPVEPGIPELVASIDSMVRQSGMQVTALEIVPAKDPPKGAPDIAVLNIAMNVSGGDYLALKRLLIVLEHDLRLTDVLSIAFSPQSAAYQLSARSYYLRKASGATVTP